MEKEHLCFKPSRMSCLIDFHCSFFKTTKKIPIDQAYQIDFIPSRVHTSHKAKSPCFPVITSPYSQVIYFTFTSSSAVAVKHLEFFGNAFERQKNTASS